MLRSLLAVLLLLTSTHTASAQASKDACADLWFARAAILDQGGYCVASPLGEAVFPNAECSAEEPEFPEFLAEQIATIEEREAQIECALDTDAAEIGIWQIDTRRALSIQPIKARKDRICVMKAPTSLRAAPSIEADQLGWLERGDLILMAHDRAGGADFASRVRRGTQIIEDIGWFSSSQCKAIS